MPQINFDASEVTPSKGFEAIPAGKYAAVINTSEEKATRSGNGTYIQLEFEIVEGEYAGRKLWNRLNLNNPNPRAVAFARADLSAICHAVNVLRPSDTCELHNLPMVINVKCRKDKNTDEIVNEIAGYESRDAVKMPVSAAAKPAGNPPGTRPAWMRAGQQ